MIFHDNLDDDKSRVKVSIYTNIYTLSSCKPNLSRLEEISKLIASALSVKQDGCRCTGRQKIYKILKLDFDKLQKEIS